MTESPPTRTVKGVSSMQLFVIECPTHGIMPVGFFGQLPHKIVGEKVEVTIECHKCRHSNVLTFDLEPTE